MCIKMRVEVPLKGTQVKVEERKVSITGPRGTLERAFVHPLVAIKLEGDTIALSTKKDRRKDKQIMNTVAAHIKNMVNGVKYGFKFSLNLVQSHFPIQMKLDKNTFLVDNFLGEKVARKVQIPAGVKIEIDQKNKMVTVESNDIELAGNIATKIEHSTSVRRKDRRIFQDGIYLVSRGPAEVKKE